MSETNWLEKIQRKIDYRFKNEDLLQQAFVRRTYAMENGGGDNEVLEFIGDRALELVITRLMMDEYGYYTEDTEEYEEGEDCNEFFSELTEGELTEVKKRLVQGKTLAKCIDNLGWQDYLIMGEGDIKQKFQNKDSVKEDLFEAIIGAVTLDSNWNLEIIEGVIDVLLKPEKVLSDDKSIDYVSIVQDWFEETYKDVIEYDYYDRNAGFGNSYFINYNEPGDCSCHIRHKTFRAVSYEEWRNPRDIRNIAYSTIQSFVGNGNSHKEAKKNLCAKIYDYLAKMKLIKSIQNEIANPNKNEAINQLETLARRGYFSIPEYTFKEGYDKDGNPIWTVHCKIKEISAQRFAKASLKKEAKKQAAYSMLKYVIENYNEE